VSADESIAYIDPYGNLSPDWSPDGRFIVSCGWEDIAKGTYYVDCTGVRATDLSTAFVLDPIGGGRNYEFSPDGTAILARIGSRDVVVNSTTGSVRSVSAPVAGGGLAWTRDANYVMFWYASPGQLGAQPCTLRIDTGEIGDCLTAPSESGTPYYYVMLPSISPSGRYILEEAHDPYDTNCGTCYDSTKGYTVLWIVPDGVDGATAP
jgi:hypothetical protein